MELTLERKEEHDRPPIPIGGGSIMTTPALNEDYWSYRVMLGDRQAIVGFPKFGTIGIGFAVEDDWNTNLPFVNCSAGEIFDHIKHNKGDDSISDDDCIAAIQIIREAASKDTGRELEA